MVDKAMAWLGDQWDKISGRGSDEDPEVDPAALVGSFKRYK